MRHTMLGLCVAVLLLPGCGTFYSIGKEAKVYGGVRADFSKAVASDTTGVTRTVAVFDVPFSLVMDTLFLPYTVGIALGRSMRTGTPRPHGHPH